MTERMGGLSAEEQAELESLTQQMQAAPDPTLSEWEQLSGAIGGDESNEREIVTDEGERVAVGQKMTRAGHKVTITEGVATMDIFPKDPRTGERRRDIVTLSHGYKHHNHKLSNVGRRNPSLIGIWYWNNDDSVKDFQREDPTLGRGSDPAIRAGADVGRVQGDEDEIDARTRRVEAEIAAARARAAADAGRDAGTQTEFDREFRGVRYRVEGTGDGARALVYLAPKNGRERAPRVVQNNSTHRMPDGAGRIVPHRFVGATGAWEPVRDDGATRTRTDDPGARTTERTIVDPAVAVRLDGVERILTEMQAGLRDLHGTRPAAAGGEPPVPPRTEPAVDPILPPPTAPTLSMLERWGEGDIPDPNSPKESLRLRMVQHIVRERARQHRGSLFNLFSRRPHPKTDAGEMRLAQEYYQDAQRAREEWPHASKVGFGATMLGGGLLGTFVLGSAWLALAPWVAIMPAVVAGMATGSLTYRQLKKEKNPHAGLIGALAGAGTALTAWFGGNWLFGDGTI